MAKSEVDHQKKFVKKTVVLIKPDGVKRGLIGEIITRFEKVGFKALAIKMVWVNKKHVARHYKNERQYLTDIGKRTLEDYKKFGFEPKESLGTNDPYKIGQKVRHWNMEALSEGPLVALLFEGVNAIEIARKMVGHTNTTEAEPGSIRGDYSADTPVLATLQGRPIRTIVHASGNEEEAEFERKLWFKEKEIYEY